MKYFLMLLIGLFYSNITMASSKIIVSDDFLDEDVSQTTSSSDDKILAFNKALGYVDATQCLFDGFYSKLSDKEKLKRVISVNLGEGEKLYYAIIYADYECFGGSGTSNYHLVELSKIGPRLIVESLNKWHSNEYISQNRKFVDFEYGFASRFIDSYEQKGDKLIISNREYDQGDCNNCASLKYQYTFQLPSLKIIEKKFLGKE